ncbi:hypothetical protein [Tenacibaculum gallaicum]|nr:hypothetical protein [Tenacibaculum gallaicum]
MKKLFLFTLLLFLLSCKKKTDYYHGYIYSKEKKPLRNLKVVEDDNLKTFSLTDEKGYFNIPELNSFGGNLVVYTENNKVIDTIHTIFSNRGEKLNYRFINGRNDTLFIDTSRFK